MPLGFCMAADAVFLSLKIRRRKEYWYVTRIMSWFILPSRVFVVIMVADLGYNAGEQFER